MLREQGIASQPYLLEPSRVRDRMVLCDASHGSLARLWVEDLPCRSAPLLFIGVSAGHNRAKLMEQGAADALSARISPGELAARLKAADRLHSARQGLVSLAGFDFDLGLRQAHWRGRVLLPLMPREFDLLLVLARHAGRAVSRDDLLRAVWRTSFDPGTNSVEVHICKLRHRLKTLRERVWIETIRQRGYRLLSQRQTEG